MLTPKPCPLMSRINIACILWHLSSGLDIEFHLSQYFYARNKNIFDKFLVTHCLYFLYIYSLVIIHIKHDILYNINIIVINVIKHPCVSWNHYYKYYLFLCSKKINFLFFFNRYCFTANTWGLLWTIHLYFDIVRAWLLIYKNC